jgi:hypothetical protein
MTDRTGRTKLVCLKCDDVDPMKTDAVKWAESSLANATPKAGYPDRNESISDPFRPDTR